MRLVAIPRKLARSHVMALFIGATSDLLPEVPRPTVAHQPPRAPAGAAHRTNPQPQRQTRNRDGKAESSRRQYYVRGAQSDEHGGGRRRCVSAQIKVF